MSTARVGFTQIIALLTMLGASVSIAADASPREHEQWKEFKSASGKFRVLFPGIPDTSEQTTKAPTGTIVSRRFTLRAEPDITYDVMYSDYPESVTSRVNPKTILDTARDGVVHRANGKLIKEKTIEPHAGVGREVEIRGADATLYTVRFVLVGARLYQALVAERKFQSPDARKFLDSFRILVSR